jgi:hypothetical protein
VNRLRVVSALGRPPLEIVADSSGPSFPFRLKQDNQEDPESSLSPIRQDA